MPDSTVSAVRIILVSRHAERSPRAVPLGAATVVQALREALGAAVDARLIDSFDDETPQDLAARIMKEDCDLLGFSLYSWNRAALSQTAALVRENSPQLIIIAGGPEASADPEGALAQAPFDLVVAGEGETAALMIARAMIEGTGIPDAPGIFKRGRAAPALRLTIPENPGNLPSPWLGGAAVPVEGGVAWELSRTCPYACTYCYESRGHRMPRKIGMERIERELARFVELRVSQIFILDPTFNDDRGRALEILKLISRMAPGIHVTIEARMELIDRTLARALGRITTSVQAGLQSVVPAVSREINRSFDRQAFIRGASFLDAEGVAYGLDLIYGLPGDTLSGFFESVDFAVRLGPNHLDIFRLSVLPGTVLRAEAEERALIHEKNPPYSILSSPGFPAQDLATATRIAMAAELFYDRGRAVAWFGALIKTVRLEPHAFFQRVAAHRGFPEAHAGMEPVQAFQETMASECLAAAGKETCMALAENLIRLHGAWGNAIADGISTELKLDYEPELLFSPESLDWVRFAKSHERHRISVTVKPDPQEGAIIAPLYKK